MTAIKRKRLSSMCGTARIINCFHSEVEERRDVSEFGGDRLCVVLSWATKTVGVKYKDGVISKSLIYNRKKSIVIEYSEIRTALTREIPQAIATTPPFPRHPSFLRTGYFRPKSNDDGTGYMECASETRVFYTFSQ